MTLRDKLQQYANDTDSNVWWDSNGNYSILKRVRDEHGNLLGQRPPALDTYYPESWWVQFFAQHEIALRDPAYKAAYMASGVQTAPNVNRWVLFSDELSTYTLTQTINNQHNTDTIGLQ